ncbi:MULTISPECIES: RES domain-containing protein [unclassified Agromyces]|uniref:RES domain-containing protein n=1 Tax=unclassified Agromyces TaxID=2639701 RepID=UPI0030145C49
MDYPEGFGGIAATLCLDHFTDEVLRELLRPEANEYECSYCQRKAGADNEPAFAVPMDLVGDRVWEAATWLYADPGFIEYFNGEPWSEEALFEHNEVLYDILGDAVDEVVVDDVIESLRDASSDREYWVSNDKVSQFALGWGAFERTVRTESRFIFIGSSARPGYEDEPPARLAKFLKALLTYVESDLLVELPTGSKLFRGRMTDALDRLRSDIEAEPSSQLGPAPSHLADAGRLNGKGIGVFYAADEIDTAVGEIALHSPYDEAIIGGFVTKRPLQILDFTRKLTTLPSIFASDEESRTRWLFARFATHFTARITAPVLLDGRQLVDYTPTQVVAEYLRYVPETRIDGIAWPSRVKAGNGKNVVLFLGPGADFRTDPPTEAELNRVGGTKLPTLTLSRDDLTEHRVKRRVKVKRLRRPEPGEVDDQPYFMHF